MLGTSIIGIGLNVNQTYFDKSLPNPISMKMITGKDYDLERLLLEVYKSTSLQVYKGQGKVSIADSYINHLYRYKQWALFEHEGIVKEMMIVGYDRFGRLVLKEKNDREVVCDLKEIIFRI